MMLIGFCMQLCKFFLYHLDLKSFLYILVVNTLCTFTVHTWRTIKYGFFLEEAKKNNEQAQVIENNV